MTRELKVGVFVIVGLVLTMVGVFMIGNTTRLWDAKVEYRAAFTDVAGLKPGAPVRMGGLDIGSVTSVGYDKDLGDTRIFARMSIVKAQAARIRTDTVATVVNKGLLGDKMIQLSVGSPNVPQLDPKTLIASEEPADMFSAANKVAAAAEEAIRHLAPLTQSLADPRFSDDVKGSVADIHALLDGIVRGDGVVHRLLFDRQEAGRIDAVLNDFDRSSERLDAVLADIEDATTRVRQGPGIAHALIYDGEMSKEVAGSMSEIHEDLRAIREGNGLAHSILYGDTSSQHVMANVNAMSDDLRAIVAGIREGKGTIGALLVDPTIYEDLKATIGNVERNEVLRAFVRYSIKADERRKAPAVNGAASTP
jgi:phospholipid/cholesterol/gamma-HCH transport system substrate-binding protein